MSMGESVGTALAIVIGIGIWMAIGFGIWRLAHMRPDPSTVGAQTRATRAILKFCVDHRHSGQAYIDHIKDCLRALEGGEVQAAIKKYQQVYFGPHGFSD
jgi:hypothetical protein